MKNVNQRNIQSIEKREALEALNEMSNISLAKIKSVYKAAKKQIKVIKNIEIEYVNKAKKTGQLSDIPIIKENAKLKIEEINSLALKQINQIEELCKTEINNFSNAINGNN